MRTIGERRYQAQEVGPLDRVPDGEGSPIGRRIVLGMLGLGAVGVAVGSRVQSGIETALRPVTQNDPTGLSGFLPTGGGFRIYDVKDRSRPKLVRFVKTHGKGVHRFDVDENHAYISTEMEGFVGNIRASSSTVS